jgi:hypothetical protein
MANTRYTVTHPDGTVSTRTSARAYTHVIVSVPATPEARKAALNRQADRREAHAAVLEAAADAGVVKGHYRGMDIDQTKFHAYDFHLEGTLVESGRTRYYEISERANNEGLHETWPRFIGDIPVVRETEEDHSGEKRVAVKVKDFVIHQARQTAARLREEATQLRIDAEKPDPRGYEALRWSSRADLAQKALSEFEYEYSVGRTLTVVPVD